MLLMFLALVSLCEFVGGERNEVEAGTKMLGPLKLSLKKPDVYALGPMNNLAMLERRPNALDPTNTFPDNLEPRTLRQTTKKDKIKCALKTAWKNVKKFTKFVFNWFLRLVQKVDEAKEPECDDCVKIRKDKQKIVGTQKDPLIGCSCAKKKKGIGIYECPCCYKVKEFNFLICVASGFMLQNKTLFVSVTVEDQALYTWSYKVDGKSFEHVSKAISCVPLPPPLAHMSGCLTPNFKKKSSDVWEFCGYLQMLLYQIPILLLKTKCFNFGGDADVTRQGSSEDDDQPAQAIVQDEDSYNSLVCLCNSEKNKAIERMKTGGSEPFVEKTSRTNWKESQPKEVPPYLAVLFIKGAVNVKEIIQSHGARLEADFPKINEMLQRTLSEKWMNNSAGSAWEQYSLSCGGVLLTKNKVLTVCACVRSFYVVNKLDRAPKHDVFPYDLTAVDIFVEIPGILRTGAETHQLDPNPSKFMTKSLCARRLEAEESWGLSSLMMAMAFTPEISDPKPGQFVQWPPRMVKKGEEVEMVAFGMEELEENWAFRDSSGRLLDFHKRAVTFHLKECPITNYTREQLLENVTSGEPFDAASRISVFCARVVNSELCDGKLGYPLVAGKQLRGLVALPVDCGDENSVAGTIFNEETIREIDIYLQSSQHPAPWHVLLLASVVVAVFYQVFWE